jgi:hypothetical protein
MNIRGRDVLKKHLFPLALRDFANLDKKDREVVRTNVVRTNIYN